jgi:germination protein M
VNRRRAGAILGCGGGATPGGADPSEPAAGDAVPAAGERIAATLFYGSGDGTALVAVEREVPLADGLLAQGRQILEAQLGNDVPEGLRPVFPEGTRLRGFYVTDRGEAFVDLSAELAVGHPGGALAEQLTVFAIVHAVTANLPAVEGVQILIGGREVDTLAGHLDLRRPPRSDGDDE